MFVYPNPYGIGERRLASIMNMPLAFLSLSAFLEKHGIRARVIDSRAEDYRTYDFDNALFVGITALTGGMIRNGLDICRHVRGRRPDLPLVWGGPHASSLPAQTVEHPLVDAVCVGEGEPVALELARCLEGGRRIEDLKGIPGLLTKTTTLEPRGWMDLDEIPPLPYDKLDLDRYKRRTFFEFPTSRGCPHRCIFCYNQAFNRDPGTGRPSFRMQSSAHVLDQLERVAGRFPMREGGFVEDNFFASKRRVVEIAEGIVRRGIVFSWFTNGVASYFRSYDDDFLALLRRSGCARIDIGGESGSPAILERICKGTVPEDILNSARRCARNDIIPSYSFIIGWPDETDDDLERTLSLIDQLAREVPRTWINGVFVITPFPGTEYLDEAVARGFVPPKDLEGWGEHLFAVDTSRYTPWHDRGRRDELMVIARLSKTDFLGGSTKPFRSRLRNTVYRAMSADARFRWRRRFFGVPYEWKLWDWAFRRQQKF